MMVLAWCMPASAEDWTTAIRVGPDPPTREVWAGADVTSQSWSVYTGSTLAPFGPVTADGWRLRAVAGYGQYRYRGFVPGKSGEKTYHGAVSFTDVLAGYQHQWGPVTLKVLAGAALANHAMTPFDFDNEVQGYGAGIKAALETWVDVSPEIWTSLDLSWSSAFGSYEARFRAGHRIGGDFSVGLEGAAAGNLEYDGGRGGAFARFAWESGEVSISGGMSAGRGTDGSSDRSFDTGGYATLNGLYRY